ncbi:MAG: phytanoyl-CoA dioxygenase family protein [Caulobacterales bacterium]|nr:phytanoyl-CoA dioxygenase family protein [Caulobacterales bacterium]
MASTIKARFERDGFIHLPAFFDAALMDGLDALVFDHFGPSPDYQHDAEFICDAATEVVPWFPQRDGVEAFDGVERDPRFAALTEDVLGAGWSAQYCMVMFSKAGTSGQAWHQDCPPEYAERFNLNRLVYTSDIVEEVGGQVVVMPGSHRRGVLPVGAPHEDLDGQITLVPRKGDLLLLHGHCWHRVLPVKAKYRFSTNYRAAPAGVPEDVTDVCVYRTMRYRFSSSEVIERRV